MERWTDKLLVESSSRDAIQASELPSVNEIEELCRQALSRLSELPSSFVTVESPVTVVGDIHGQLFDLLELIRVGGPVPDTNYLFLGDYVDRGHYSVETILLLFSLLVRYPKNITLLRGNHETRQITQVYGFYDECVRKYNSPVVWRAVTEVFDALPVAGLINSPGMTVFAVHAGLSPVLKTLDEIKQLKYNSEVPHEGPVCDLLWSDPDEAVEGWGLSQRGAGYIFGEDIVSKFNQVNGVDLICRSHQLVMEGFKEIFQKQLVTVWSAPNYCYRCGNQAAILQLEGSSVEYNIFSQAPDSVRVSPQGPDYFL